jgi:hypothetical protein
MSLLTAFVPTTKTFALYNNTYCGKATPPVDSRGFGYEGVGATAAPGMLAGARNNLVFCSSSPCEGYLVHKGPTGSDVAGTYTNVDYNWRWNITTGPYYPSGTAYSPNPPGAHDTTGDPHRGSGIPDRGQMQSRPLLLTDIVAKFAKMNDDTG